YVVDDKKSVRLDNNYRTANFWTAEAVKRRGVEETRLRLYWAWNGGEGWTASTDPPGQFSRYRYPVLHKLYVLRDLSASSANKADGDKQADDRDSTCEAFLTAFLPELDNALFGNKGG